VISAIAAAAVLIAAIAAVAAVSVAAVALLHLAVAAALFDLRCQRRLVAATAAERKVNEPRFLAVILLVILLSVGVVSLPLLKSETKAAIIIIIGCSVAQWLVRWATVRQPRVRIPPGTPPSAQQDELFTQTQELISSSGGYPAGEYQPEDEYCSNVCLVRKIQNK
jgi:hypothetical protein